MSRLVNKCMYFIHIPKNAGTSFIETYCNGRQTGHIPIKFLPPPMRTMSLAIVRNPYERLVSIYEYNRLEKSYWHSSDGSTKYQEAPLYKICTKLTFEEFVMKLQSVFHRLNMNNDIEGIRWFDHCVPQSYWVTDDYNNIVVSNIIKYENLKKELLNLGLDKPMKKVNITADYQIKDQIIAFDSPRESQIIKVIKNREILMNIIRMKN